MEQIQLTNNHKPTQPRFRGATHTHTMKYNSGTLEKEVSRKGRGYVASFYNTDGMSFVTFERDGQSLIATEISKRVMHGDAELNEMIAFLEGFAAARGLFFEVGALDV